MLLCCVADGESDWLVGSCADHQDRAWFGAGADEHVVGFGWAVEVVPLPKLAFLVLRQSVCKFPPARESPPGLLLSDRARWGDPGLQR